MIQNVGFPTCAFMRRNKLFKMVNPNGSVCDPIRVEVAGEELSRGGVSLSVRLTESYARRIVVF
jgi:hypothetical protein